MVGSTIFLSFKVLSVCYLLIVGIVRFAGIEDEPQSIFYAGLVMLLVGLMSTIVYSALKGAWKYVLLVVVPALLGAIAFGGIYLWFPAQLQAEIANQILAPTTAALAVLILMGGWGLVSFLVSCLISIAVYFIGVSVLPWAAYLLGVTLSPTIFLEQFPWNLNSRGSVLFAWLFIGTYVILNAGFLQSYLGDAARYFRNSPANVAGRREIRKQAVDMLASLHTCGFYDRVIVVAHSLGTVVAYDMMRAYYARIARRLRLPADPAALEELNKADLAELDADAARARGRSIIRQFAHDVPHMAASDRIRSLEDWRKPAAWLVTDFVTLGAALVHAEYLMCLGNTFNLLDGDFGRRVKEREFPTCPPAELPGDGLLTFTPEDPPGAARRFHHGGPFALTRWTNLFFPMSQILWGDPVGGPLAPLFGSHIKDVSVYTGGANRPDWLAHVKYWSFPDEESSIVPPHILALRDAINLADA